MPYRKRVYIEEIPRVSIGKDYHAIESLIANEGGIKITINEVKRKLVFFFRYYKEFPIPEDGVVICSISCNYGGIRYFYVCPCCRKRYRHLYISRGKKHPRLICRKCRYLSYRCQSESEYDRVILKLCKLLKKHGFKNQYPYKKNRPKGIHQTTFKKVQRKIQHLVNEINNYPIIQELVEYSVISRPKN